MEYVAGFVMGIVFITLVALTSEPGSLKETWNHIVRGDWEEDEKEGSE